MPPTKMPQYFISSVYTCMHYFVHPSESPNPTPRQPPSFPDEIIEKNIIRVQSYRTTCPACKKLTTQGRNNRLHQSLEYLRYLSNKLLKGIRIQGKKYHSIPFDVRSRSANVAECADANQAFGVETRSILEDPLFKSWVKIHDELEESIQGILSKQTISIEDAERFLKHVKMCQWYIVRIAAKNRILKEGVDKMNDIHLKRQEGSTKANEAGSPEVKEKTSPEAIGQREQETKEDRDEARKEYRDPARKADRDQARKRELERILESESYRQELREKKHDQRMPAGRILPTGKKWPDLRLVALAKSPKQNWLRRLKELEELFKVEKAKEPEKANRPEEANKPEKAKPSWATVAAMDGTAEWKY